MVVDMAQLNVLGCVHRTYCHRARVLRNAEQHLSCTVPCGAFYAFVSCDALIGRVTAGDVRLTSDEDVALALLDEANVAVVHGSAFGLGPFVRIAYALDDKALAEAAAAFSASARRLRLDSQCDQASRRSGERDRLSRSRRRADGGAAELPQVQAPCSIVMPARGGAWPRHQRAERP